MRRAAWLVLLAVPALSAAQVPPQPSAGQVTFPTVPLTPIDGYINAAECQAGTITFSWAIQYETGHSFADVQAGGSYQVYSSNNPDNTTVNTGACPQSNDDKVAGTLAGPVSTPFTSALTDPFINQVFDTSLIASTAGQGACNTVGTDIMICVQARDGSHNPVGTARTRLNVQTTGPAAPTNVQASTGDSALNISWDAPSGTVTAYSYEIDATPVSTIIDPVTLHRSPRITTTTYRFGGLVNGQTYQVKVRAFSIASNVSPDSLPGYGVADQVFDFWSKYKAEGGRDPGGCASGAAGVLALAGVAAFLAFRRRRA